MYRHQPRPPRTDTRFPNTTLFRSDSLLDARRNNYLAALSQVGGSDGGMALAWLDMSTGEFGLTETGLAGPEGAGLGADPARIGPRELVLPANRLARPEPRATGWASWRARGG